MTIIDRDRPAIKSAGQYSAITTPLDAPPGPHGPPAWAIAKVADQLRHLIDPGRVVELRALRVPDRDGRPVTMSGTFLGDELDALAAAALSLSGYGGIYYSLNPLKPERHVRQAPRVRRAGPRETAADRDVLHRDRLLIDVDRVKQPGDADRVATDQEHAGTRALAERVRDYLRSAGLPDPVLIDSGNGHQLVYRIDPLPVVLPLAPDDVIRLTLAHLADRFDGADGTVDTKVFNPARIARCPGTLNVKGQESADRPYGRCRVLDPGSGQSAPHAVLAELAARAPCPAAKTATVTVPAGVPRAERTAGPADLPRADVIRRAWAYLRTIPGAVSGQRGHDRTFRAACVLVLGYGLTVDEAYPLLASWNATCQPVWSDGELRHKLADADRQTGPRGYLLADRTPAVSVPPETPAPDPLAEADEAAADLDGLLRPAGRCKRPRPVVGRRANGCRCVAAFPCGSLSTCRECRGQRLYEAFGSSASYLRRTAGAVALYAAVLPGATPERTRKAVRRAGGEYVDVMTADPAGCGELIGLPADAVSVFSPVVQGVSTGEKTDSPGDGHLAVLALPPGADPPAGYTPVAPAVAIRAVGEALSAVPSHLPRMARVVRQSRGWGDRAEHPPGDFAADGAAALTMAEVREVVDALGVSLSFDMERAAEKGVGWRLPPAPSLALSLLLRGAGAPRPPSKDLILTLARQWVRAIPSTVGDGPAVERGLRANLWHPPTAAALADVAEADREDRQAREDAEAWRRTVAYYRAHPGEAGPLMRLLVGLPEPTVAA